MKQGEDKITFEVQESLFFESGQEIAEMVSISLDPDIVVQAYKDDIQIRGIILLQGEYKKEIDSYMEQSYTEEDAAIRYIEKVMDGDNEETAMFSHRFPVEISVPPYRVQQLEQISVSVDAFDYELPSSNKLHVYASLHIHGINPEPSTLTKQAETQLKTDNVVEDNATGSQTEVKTSPESLTNEHTNDSTIESNSSSRQVDPYDEEERDKKSASKLRKVDEQAVSHDNDSEIEVIEMEDVTASSTLDEKAGIDIQFSEQQEQSDEAEVKDVAFLAELFHGDEELYTKMKIYITKDDDTIESIAKRYEVPVLQLMKDNEMSADSLEGGQLIKIPNRSE